VGVARGRVPLTDAVVSNRYITPFMRFHIVASRGLLTESGPTVTRDGLWSRDRPAAITGSAKRSSPRTALFHKEGASNSSRTPCPRGRGGRDRPDTQPRVRAPRAARLQAARATPRPPDRPASWSPARTRGASSSSVSSASSGSATRTVFVAHDGTWSAGNTSRRLLSIPPCGPTGARGRLAATPRAGRDHD
jgi:hypothetical protein